MFWRADRRVQWGIRRWQQASSGSCPLCLHLSIWKQLSKVNCNKSCSGVLFIRMACVLDQWDVQQLIDLQHLAVRGTINSCIWKEVLVELTQLILKFTISRLKYLQATLIMLYDTSVPPRSRVWTFSVEGNVEQCALIFSGMAITFNHIRFLKAMASCFKVRGSDAV